MASLQTASKTKSKKDTLPPPPLLHPTRTIPRRLVPFRHPDFTDDQIKSLTEDPCASKDRLLKNFRKTNTSPTKHLSVSGRSNGSSPAVSPGGVSPCSDTSDGELVSAMMARLMWLEAKLSEAHRQLQEKEKTVVRLEETIAIMKQGRASCEGSNINELETTCLKLQNQVHHMEKFIGEYGLVWNGERFHRLSRDSLGDCVRKDSDTSSRNSLQAPSSPARSSSPSEDSFTVDYDLVIDNVRDLNIMAGEGVPQICLMSEGSKFKVVDNVPLALYSNGISLCGGPFRSFNENETKQCVRDLMDGYFPAELQHCYPNGVPLKVFDKRDTEFEEQSSNRSSRGSLCVKTLNLPANCSPSFSPVSPRTPSTPISSFSSPGRTPDAANSAQVFNQTLINFSPRNSVHVFNADDEHTSKDNDVNVIVIQTTALLHRNRATKPVTTLRIRSECGSETYLMKLYTSDTIGTVRMYLDRQRSSRSSDYDIVALYPRRVFSNVKETLEACGLVPNAALYLHQVVCDRN